MFYCKENLPLIITVTVSAKQPVICLFFLLFSMACYMSITLMQRDL